MKKIILYVFILISISCKKNKYTIQSLFLEELKESSSFYNEEVKQITASLKVKLEEHGYKSEEITKLTLINRQLEKLFENLKNKNKHDIITLQEKVLLNINSENKSYLIDKVDKEKLEILDNQMLYFYLKTVIYKSQYKNCIKTLNTIPPFCGFKKISKKQAELIQIIEDSNIK